MLMFHYIIILLLLPLLFRYRNPMRTEDFLNPVEKREIKELVDEVTIIQLIQEGGEIGMREMEMRRETMLEMRREMSCQLFLLRKG